jgi:hypothetical protein
MRRLRSLVVVFAAVMAAARVAAAGQILLAWNANTEPDIAGYIVQYQPVGASSWTSVNVGNVTQYPFNTPAPGVAYDLRVIAYNTSGLQSAPSAIVVGNGDGTVPPGLTVDRASLGFGLMPGATAIDTRTQTVHMTQSAGVAVPWTVASNVSWLQVSPASGTGSGAFAVSVVPALVPPTSATATITITAPGAANVVAPISVALTVIPAGTSAPPIGSFDSPTNNTTGVTGSLAITGWALDDIDVSRVRILRDPVSGETPGQLVYIGDATLVEDARPDVVAAYPTLPDNYRAGWGYLALTNMLPNLGNGTFRLYAYVDDVDGHTTLLGTRTITCTNATATAPFGAIDTPAPGATVSGVVMNFGWVLSPAPARADVPGGGKVTVLIDGVAVGSPGGWSARSDLTALFPVAQYPGINNALGVFPFNSTTLADGVHTIAWVVTDSLNHTQGIGSRFFRVFNGTGPALMAGLSADSVAAGSAPDEIVSATIDRSAVQWRRGFDVNVPFQALVPDADGRVTLQAEEVDRIELTTDGATEGYLHVGTDLRPLPAGSHLDPQTGVFVWQPAAGFVGVYDLTFVRHTGSSLSRQDVRIVLNPKTSNRVGPQVIVDIVRPFVAGWAADLDSPSGTGISTIHVWAYPVDASGMRGAPLFVGVAAYGGDRPDVAAIYGDRFRNAGFGIDITGLPPGTYDLALFPWSTVRGGFAAATIVRIEVK